MFDKRSLILGNNLVSAGAEFLEFAIGWDADNIRRVDFHQNQAVIPASKVGCILKSSSMEAIRASNLFVVIDLVARHLKHLSNTVEESACMLVGEIVANSLVSKERTCLSERQMLMLKERVEFIDCTFAWVQLQACDKLEDGQAVNAISKEIDDAFCNHRLDGITIDKHRAILNLDLLILGVEVEELAGRVKCQHQGIKILGLVCRDGRCKHRVACKDGILFTINNDCQEPISRVRVQQRCGYFHNSSPSLTDRYYRICHGIARKN